MKFTDKYIKSLKAKDKPYVVSADNESRGLGRLQIKVYPTGTKKFQYQYFIDGVRKRMEFGVYDQYSLSQARKEYLRLSIVLQNGDDPSVIRAIKKLKQEQIDQQKTFIELVEDYLEHIESKLAPSTVKRTKLAINLNLRPFISDTLLPFDFGVDQGRELIYKIYNRGAKEQANIFKCILMSTFKFAIDFDNSPEQFKKPNLYNVKTNPIRDIAFSIPSNVGERWLDEAEVKKLWHAPDLPKTTKLYFRLALALAGQRICEVYYAKAEEIDFEENTLTIPQERVKIRRRGDHIVPLSPLAISIIDELWPTRGKAGHLWPHRDHEKEHAHISTIRMATQRWCKKNKITNFSPRDIRRTCKTLMGKSGIHKEARDLLQQHNKSDVSSKHYDRYDYMDEKRKAISEWTKYLNEIIT
jgi:integrase